ncbi:hypothetical protein SOPP22_13170 [Shewanella sp. OPT22]|nr:hypothetical protein SOPP22_13170 [Shewanella sp. OPT22]
MRLFFDVRMPHFGMLLVMEEKIRQHALGIISKAIKLSQYSNDDDARSKLYLHHGMLEMAMAIENNMPYFFI